MNKILTTLVFLALLSCAKNKKSEITIEGDLTPIVKIELSDELISSNFKDKNDITLEEAQQILYLFKMNKDSFFSETKVTGRYTLEENILIYKPMFSFGYDLTFRIQANIDGEIQNKKHRTSKRIIPEKQGEVVACYPLQDTVPYNILCFQFLFSKDMKQTKDVDYSIRVYEGEKEIMWNEKRMYWISPRHFAVTVHPTGLILGGHNPKNKVRPAFFKDKEYSIVITDSLKDDYGRNLIKEYRKTFVASEIDMKSPTLINQTKPKANTTEPIVLTFSETMDYTSLIQGVTVYTKNNKLIEGKILPTENGHIWNFFPNKKWSNNLFNVVLGKNVIDLGNNRMK